MIDKSHKKILMFGILIIFIGAAFAPNISGYNKNISDLSMSEGPAGAPINDDFINAYWEFDECSGNTVGDSSGHNYDGIRHGATWITNGYDGCALEFDGIDDYVDLTVHSKKIGINKTDDFIISFDFKTSSNEDGIIYSATGYKTIPEFRIGLLENGSLLFKIWTTMCGISLTSSSNYNDGSWHEVEIIFNGITTDPTVDIYIDHNLDASMTDWLCDIESVDFLDTTIGKRASESTGFFDGVIDEFKFIKYEGGNEQEIPEISGPEYGDPDTEYDYTFITNDPEGDDVYIMIDWGDGEITDWLGPHNSGEEAVYSHSWDDEGAYEIKAKSKDMWHYSGWSIDGYEVKIGNQAPDAPIIGGPKYGDPDVEYTYSFRSKDFESNNVKYIIKWDDGKTQETEYFPSNQTVEIRHEWDEKGDYQIKAKAVDIHGKEGVETDPPYHIRIGDQPPRKPDIDGPISGKKNVEIDFEFTGTDPENDQVWFDIKWGDGEQLLDVGPYDSGELATISHEWEDSGTFQVQARARDKFDYWGDWEDFQIKIPRVKGFNYDLFELLLKRFPNAFPIIRNILGL